MSHQDRRDPLPKGYQFGDARLDRATGISIRFIKEWDIERDLSPANYDVWIPKTWVDAAKQCGAIEVTEGEPTK